MHYIIERHKDEVILPNSIVTFDADLDRSLSLRPPLGAKDFKITKEGHIKFYTAGSYVVRWQTTQMTGMSSDGDYFELKYRDWDDPDEPWKSFYAPYSHVSDARSVPIYVGVDDVAWSFDPNSCSVGPGGYIIENTCSLIIPEPQTYTIALWNTSNESIKLSPYDHVKASILIFGVPHLINEIDPDTGTKAEVEKLRIGLDAYELEKTVADLTPRVNRIIAVNEIQDNAISNLAYKLGQFILDYTSYYEMKPEVIISSFIEGLTIHVNVQGFAHHFSISGVIATSPLATEKVMIIEATDSASGYLPLSHYLGDPTISPCHYEQTSFGSSNKDMWMPIFFDKSGIYLLNPPQEALNAGSRLAFNQSLILGGGL